MRYLLLSALATSVAVAALSPAVAADMPDPPPVFVPAEEPAYGGWYLRGDIGFTHQDLGELDNDYWATAGTFTVTSADFSPSYFIGAGVGYQFGAWFRTDATIEYRAKSDFDGSDTYTNTVPSTGANYFDTDKTEIVGMLNGYVDLGTWGGLTPYLGAGVGFAHIMIGDLTDRGFNSVGGATAGNAGSKTTTNFAWALMAGLGYEVAPGVSAELGYRYLDMGDAESGIITDAFGGTFGALQFKDIISHDVRFGLRWTLGGVAPVAMAEPEYPIISK
ncbi:MAG: outer membrane protein [Labrys sp. (in: a-proteobacteria)]